MEYSEIRIESNIIIYIFPYFIKDNLIVKIKVIIQKQILTAFNLLDKIIKKYCKFDINYKI